ncbi:MAG: molybdopterin-dependent oxidoreductase [Mycobacteriaceae bacterium]
MSIHLRWTVIGATSLALALSGCSQGSDPTPQSSTTLTSISEAALNRGNCRSVPAPTPSPNADTVLTVTGRVANGVPVKLNLATLDALPQIECTVDDRQAEGRTATFTGPLLSTVLVSIGADPQTTLHTLALNDYAADLPVSDLKELPVVLATRLDGETMSVAHYGPTRVIYPTSGYELDKTVYDPRWVWQLASIEVA